MSANIQSKNSATASAGAKSQINLLLGLVAVAGLTLAPLASTAAPAAKAGDKPAEKASDKPADKASDKKEATRPEPVIENIVNVQAETLVDHPAEYLNKNVRFNAQFSGYNSLSLDYKPALRPAKSYLSFSVLREHSKVPLSELKLAMINPKDEKDPFTALLLKLKDKDEIEVIGKVFSTALDEPWVDVLKLKLIKAAPDDKKADAASTPAKDKDGKDKDTKDAKDKDGKDVKDKDSKDKEPTK